MRVLVVGGCGYIGSMLVPELVRRRHEVHVIDMLWFGCHIDHDEVEEGDASSLGVEDLRGIDALIFLGGLSNDPMADFDPMANFQYNAALPSYLAYIAKKAGVKVFIHGGSCSVYGLLEPDCKATEDLPPRAQTPYGVSKLMAEFGVMRQNGNEMRVVNFRQGTVGGWSPRMRFDLAINSMVKSAYQRGIIEVNDINAERPILDIRDAVSAYAQALSNEDLRGVYNLFSHNTSIGKLATRVRGRFGSRAGYGNIPEIVIHNRHDNRSYTASNHKAVAAGVYCLAKLDHTIDSVIQRIEDFKDLDDPIYNNIATFKAKNLSSSIPAASHKADSMSEPAETAVSESEISAWMGLPQEDLSCTPR